MSDKHLPRGQKILSVRLKRALKNGFVYPKELASYGYRLSKGLPVRRTNAARLAVAIGEFEAAPIRIEEEAPVISERLNKIAAAAMIWVELTSDEREMVTYLADKMREARAKS